MGQKIVINQKHGGFNLSTEAVEWLRENDYEVGYSFKLAGEYYDDGSGPVDEFIAPARPMNKDIRDSTGIVAVVEELGDDADGQHADLEVVEIPDGVEWQIEEYDGWEWVAEEHRTWPEQ